jgi:transposase
VAYSYAPGRGGEHAMRLLDGDNGILQVDGYAAYKKLAAPTGRWRSPTVGATCGGSSRAGSL